MGLSSSSATVGPSKEFSPYIKDGANALQGAYSQVSPKATGLMNIAGDLMPGAVDQARHGNANVNAATQYNTDVLGGKYLGQGNPYLQQMIDKTGNDVRNQTEAAMGTHGLSYGSDYTKMIADRVAQASLGMRYGDYSQERGYMGQAAGQSAGLAEADNAKYTGLETLGGLQMSPLNAAGQYSNSLGGLLGGYQTQTKTPSLADSIGKGLSIFKKLLPVPGK